MEAMMKQVPTIKVLKEAREILSDESKWARYRFAYDENGTCVDPEDPAACKFCVLGAIRRAMHDNGLSSSFHEVPNGITLLRSMNTLASRTYALESHLDRVAASECNDRFGYSAATTILDAAIAELEGAG